MAERFNVIEETRVNNTCEATREVAAEIRDYIQKFNHMEGIDGLYITEMSLSLDEKVYTIEKCDVERDRSVDSDNENVINITQERKTIFAEDDELIKALDDIEEAGQIVFNIAYDADVWGEYGIDRKYLFENREGIYDDVEWRVIEYDQCFDSINTDHFGKGTEGNPVADKQAVGMVQKWLVETVNVVVDGVDNAKIPAAAVSKLSAWGDEFLKKYEGCNPAQCDEEEFFYGDGMILDAKDLDEFIADLQKIVDIADAHNLEPIVTGTIMAMETVELAAVRVKLENRKVVAEYIKL